MKRERIKVLAAMFFIVTRLLAYDFQVDNIYYTRTSSNTVKVVQKSDDYTASYTGTVNIPESVSIQGIVYQVTALGDKAFHWCKDVTSVKLPNSVLSIGEKCFNGCFSLNSIILPNKLDSISDYTFSSCSKLTTLTLPTTVRSIGRGAFESCQSLQSISLPMSVERIGSDAFSYCSSLTSINLPTSLKSIESGTFFQCTSLASVTIPNSVEVIQSEAFSQCRKIPSLLIPSSVNIISPSAFTECCFSSISVDESNTVYDSRNNCNAIIETNTNTLIIGCNTTVIPSTIKSIGECAFNSCKLESLAIPTGVETIWLSAFNNCSLKSLIIPSTVNALRGHGEHILLESIAVSHENEKYDSRDYCNAIIETNTNTLLMGCKNSTIPESVDTIGAYAFAFCLDRPSVVFPSTLKCIKEQAFTYCYGITDVDLPDGLETIEERAFSVCLNLTTVRIPGTVKNIGYNAFMGCDDLTSLTIEEGAEQIEGQAFSGTGLTSIHLPQSIRSLGAGVFNGTPWYNNQPDGIIYVDHVACGYKGNMPSNASVEIKEGITVLGEYLFEWKSQLTEVVLPNSLKHIGAFAFFSCYNLKSIQLPDGLETIGRSAFTACGFEELLIPASVEHIWHADGEGAFRHSTELTTIRVAEGNPIYDSRNDCNAIIETSTNKIIVGSINTIIQKSVKSIGADAFTGSKIESIIIPSSVDSIGFGAFNFCSKLKYVSIPPSIKYIGNVAFQSCRSLTEFVCKANTPIKLDPSTFWDSNYNNATLYVPTGCKEAYINAEVWKDFKNIEERAWPIDFADDKVKALCVSQWDANGDGELDENEAAAVTTIGTVFKGYEITSFNELQYFTGLTTIEYCAFQNCNKMAAITLPAGLTSIGQSAFSGCSSLVSIAIPNGVTNIGNSAFSGCTGLTSITFGNNLESIGENAFHECRGLISVIMPSSLKTIGLGAYSDCTGLSTVVLPNGLQSIGFGAFDNCFKLESVTIPSSVSDINYSTFSGCI